MKINLPGVLRAMAKAEDRVEMVAEDPSVIDYCANAADTLDANDAEIAALRASVAALTAELERVLSKNVDLLAGMVPTTVFTLPSGAGKETLP